MKKILIKTHLLRSSAFESGISLVEVMISLTIAVFFTVSAISAFVWNQKYSQLAAYRTEAVRINQYWADHWQSTPYIDFKSTNIPPQFNFSGMRSTSSGGSAMQAALTNSSLRKFNVVTTNSLGTVSWTNFTTNVSAILAYTTLIKVTNVASYSNDGLRVANISTYWSFASRSSGTDAKYTNTTVIFKAKDN